MDEKNLPSIAVIDEATGLYRAVPMNHAHTHTFSTEGFGVHTQELKPYVCEDRTKWHTHDISISSFRNEVTK